jgi:hypothetical protein
MNETKKRATGKQIRSWAVEAILPAILFWVAIGLLINGYHKLARDLGEAIFGIVAGVFVLYCTIFFLFARLEQRFLRLSETTRQKD